MFEDVEFDRYTIGLLVLRPDAPDLDDDAADALQDAHLAHLAELHDAGYLLAAGPLRDETYRGLTIFNVEPDRARELMDQDPTVKAGRLTFEVFAWMLPAGAMSFSPSRFPRSAAEADS